MEIIRHSEKCAIKQSNSGRIVEAEVHDFKEHHHLVVVLNKSVKLNMTWNGKLYEGKMAGLDFVTSGPVVNKTKTGIRG